MRLDAGCEIEFEILEPTPMLLMLRPRSGEGQWVEAERYALKPRVPASEYADAWGNLCQRIVARPGRLHISTQVRVDTDDTIALAPGAPRTPVDQLPVEVIGFLLASRYAESDALADQARDVTAGATPGYDQVEAIRAWIHRSFEYRYGVSNESTSARDTIRLRKGVCRDFAHVGIALTRALGIPARYVAGYLHGLEPMDLHAWFEAYVDGRWYTFDATQAGPRGGRVIIGYGRDALDVALATPFGDTRLDHMQAWVRAVPEAAG